ncbi:MAG: glycoside hydrolase family 13 protein [Ancrocorticia sp.]
MTDSPLPLLVQPHHDGSALYVPKAPAYVGDTAIVRLRVPAGAEVSAVSVRIVEDGEHLFVKAVPEVVSSEVPEGTTTDSVRVDGTGDGVAAGGATSSSNSVSEHDTWWRAELPCPNRVLHYRFLLDGGPTGVRWLNAAGLWHRDVPDQSDFKLTTFGDAPEWVKGAVVYQIFPDRFATTGRYREPAPEWANVMEWDDQVDGRGGKSAFQFFGGDLDGVREHLDHLKGLGVNVIYLTPFFPAGSCHRYDATTFMAVDPLLGGDAAFERLIEAAHQSGMRVMGDLTTNHTGNTHEWFRAAEADPSSDEHGFYLWEEDGTYGSWWGIPSLPKLNYDDEHLRERMFTDENSVVRSWLRKGMDGWRIDVANMSGRYRAQDVNHDVARLTREAAVAERSDALVVAEHVHDYTPDLQGDGWHGVMNYSGFTKAVWTWLLTPADGAEFLGAPVVVPSLDAGLVVDTIRDFTSRVPWQNLVASFNLLGSHDTSRPLTMFGGNKELLGVAIGLLMTMPSVPMVTYGDEIGMEGKFGEDGRRPMPWGNDELWHGDLFSVYHDLIAVRHGSEALSSGGLRWVYAEDDAIMFLRESVSETVLVHCARSAHEPIVLASALLPGAEGAELLYGPGADVNGESLVLAADGPAVTVLSWPTAD